MHSSFLGQGRELPIKTDDVYTVNKHRVFNNCRQLLTLVLELSKIRPSFFCEKTNINIKKTQSFLNKCSEEGKIMIMMLGMTVFQ
jgi:hypothetical protein